MNILGFFKKMNLALIEKDGTCFVVDKHERRILYKGNEEDCSKVFIMIASGFVKKETLFQ